jgi:hypothetical protein
VTVFGFSVEHGDGLSEVRLTGPQSKMWRRTPQCENTTSTKRGVIVAILA